MLSYFAMFPHLQTSRKQRSPPLPPGNLLFRLVTTQIHRSIAIDCSLNHKEKGKRRDTDNQDRRCDKKDLHVSVDAAARQIKIKPKKRTS